jgi:hypothetical protein
MPAIAAHKILATSASQRAALQFIKSKHLHNVNMQCAEQKRQAASSLGGCGCNTIIQT